tara:strand:- start:8 stop:733 length:726 start_codon:yes stop_codon:yes gene_type:complete
MSIPAMTLIPFVTGFIAVLLVSSLSGTKFEIKGVVGPYFGALAVMFGLFASLMAGDTWREISRANSLVMKEINSLKAIESLGKSLPQGNSQLREITKKYVSQDIQTNKQINIERTFSLRELPALFELQDYVLNDELGSPLLKSRLFLHIDELRDLRLERLEIKETHSGPLKLTMLVILGILTQIAIAMCHAGNRSASIYTVGLFSIAFAVTVFFTSAFDDLENFDQVVDLSILDLAINEFQ